MTDEQDDGPPTPLTSSGYVRLAQTATDLGDVYDKLIESNQLLTDDVVECADNAARCRKLASRFSVWAQLSDNVVAFERETLTKELQALATGLGMLARRLGIDLQALMHQGPGRRSERPKGEEP